MRSKIQLLSFLAAQLSTTAGVVSAAAEETDAGSVVPLLQQLCADCHGEKKQKAKFALHDIDPDIAGGGDIERWEKILEMLSIGDMPPEDEKQPTAKQREQAVAWITDELKKIGRGPVEGSEVLPEHGNRIDHEALFSGEHKGPAYTRSRLWRISPEIYKRFASKIDMARKFSAPLRTASAGGIRDYSFLYADEATIKTMLQNCKRAATTMILGRVDSRRNRSSTKETKQGGRSGSRHKAFAEFVKSEGTPDQTEFDAVLEYAIKFLLDRGMTDADRERYIDGFLRPNVGLAGREVGLAGMLTTLMMSPEFLFRMELGLGEELPDGRRMLAPREIAYALSHALFDYVDPKALAAAEKGELASREDVGREFRRMLRERDRGVRGPVGNHLWVMGKGAGVTDSKLQEASHPRLLRFFREYFGYLKVADVFKDDTRHDGKHDAYSLIKEADWFVLGILREDQQVLRRLLTDDWYFVQPWKSKRPTFTAPSYNIDDDTPWPESPQGFRQAPVKMPEGQRAGMLTHPAWLASYSGNFENDPVRRGKWIQEHLLGGVVPDIPIGVAAQLPEEPHRTLRQRFDVVGAEQCWRCHKKMNPLGNPFEAYDDFGRFRRNHLVDGEMNVIATEFEAFSKTRRVRWRDSHKKNHPPEDFTTVPVDTSGHLAGTGDANLDGNIDGPIDLTGRLAKSDRVRQVFVRYVFRYWMGRNETLDDSPTLMAMDKAYVESEGSFRELLVALVTSDSFLYRR